MAGFWTGAGGAIASAGASLLGSLFGGLFSSSNQEKQFQQQKELMKYSHELGLENMDYQQKLGHQTFDYTFGKESSLNQRLMENSPTIQKQAMLDAGINPASQFGTFSGNLAQSSAPTYTPQAGAPQAPSFEPFGISSVFAGLADILANVKLKKAQARDLNADAKGKELDNEGKEDVNNLVSNVETHTDSDGNAVITWHRGASTVQGWSFKKDFRKWITEQNKLDAEDVKALLERKIAEGQLQDNSFMDAMVQMPGAELSKLLEETLNLQTTRRLINSQITLNDEKAKLVITENELKMLEKDIQEHTNIYEAVKKLGDPNVSWHEKIVMLVASAISLASIRH